MKTNSPLHSLIFGALALLAFGSITSAQACIDHGEVKERKVKFESHILFHKDLEYVALQQHLAYIDGRPYFNYSLCLKDLLGDGYNLAQASQYDFDKDCTPLGPWTPVYGPKDEEVFTEVFFDLLDAQFEDFVTSLEKRKMIAPIFNSFSTTFGSFRSLLMVTGGAILVRQAYTLAPMANTFSQRTGNRMARNLGWLMAALGIVDITYRAHKINKESSVHQKKLQEVISTLQRTEKQMGLMLDYKNKGSDLRSYQVYPGIVNKVLEAFAATMFEIQDRHGHWMCQPYIPENERAFRKET